MRNIAHWLLDAINSFPRYKNTLGLTFFPTLINHQRVYARETSEIDFFFSLFQEAEMLKASITEILYSEEDKAACLADLQKLLDHLRVELQENKSLQPSISQQFKGVFIRGMGRRVAVLEKMTEKFSEQQRKVADCLIEKVAIDLLEAGGRCTITYRHGIPIVAHINASESFTLYKRGERDLNYVYDLSYSEDEYKGVPKKCEIKAHSYNVKTWLWPFPGQWVQVERITSFNSDGVPRSNLEARYQEMFSEFYSINPLGLELVYESGKKEMIPLP